MLTLRYGCLAALAFALGVPGFGPSARAADVKCFPDDTELVVTVNLKQIRTCELVAREKDALDQPRALLNRWAGDLPVLRCLRDAGLDPFRDLTAISLAGPRGKEPKITFLV